MCRVVRCKSERVIAERRDPDHVGEDKQGATFVGNSHRLRASDSPNIARTTLVIASAEEACVMGRKNLRSAASLITSGS